jgi:hypothetical protein
VPKSWQDSSLVHGLENYDPPRELQSK